MNQAMHDGEFVGGRPPYGYRKDPENCHRLLVNEDTAPIVRQIFQWTIDGVSLNVIVKRLNEGGIMTPGYYLAHIGLITSKQLMGNGKWQTWTLRKILTDEVYTGDMVQGKHTNVGHKQVPTKPEDWIVVHDTHEPIISREMFAKVQAIREQVAEKAKNRAAKVPYTENILRGRVFCGCCGKNLHRLRSSGHYIFHCISNDRIGKGACDAKIYVREADLFSTIVTIIRQKAEVALGDAMRLKQCDGSIAAQKAQVDQEISELQHQTVKNKALLASLYESFVKGILTRSEYLEMSVDYSQKISGAVERVHQLQTRQAELEQQMKQLTSMADKLAAVDKDTTLSALLVNQLIERVTVNSPDDVSICFAFESGFERMMEVLTDE